MKYLSIIAVLTLFLAACDRKPYVEQKLKLEKKSDGCVGIQPNFRMISNFGGERFEFEKCLPDGFEEKSLQTSRAGDTVLVSFGKPKTPANRYQVTLDIDSYPEYHFISIDGETYNIIPANP